MSVDKDAPIIDFATYQQRKKVAIDTDQNGLVQLLEDILAGAKAGKIVGLICLAKRTEECESIDGGGQLTYSDALWLAESLRKKFGPS